MEFDFSGSNIQGRERGLQRFFEIVPGATSWMILIGMTMLAFCEPLVAAVIIIAFDLYWLLRLLYMTLFLILSYSRLSMEKGTDWMKKAKELDQPGELCLKDIVHLVIIPVSKETQEVIEPGIKSFVQGAFPSKQVLVVIALEERAGQEVKEGVKKTQEVYRRDFLDLLVAIHPDGIQGEAKVKGANTTFAAKRAAEYFLEKDIPFEKVVASCFDADTVIDSDYFAALTYYYMASPERERASFQPVPVYNNNIWEAPGITRVLETGSSFFQLIEATNPEKLVTFSSHSMSFKALVDIGYWPVDMISDDSAIFWKAFIHYDGKYRVVPMYTTLSMDAVVAENWWKTVVNVYKQKRRWAWGVENFPIIMRAFLKNKKISFFNKMRHLFKLFEGHIAWATWAFLLTFIGWLPAIFAGREFTHTVFYYSAPRIAGTIFHLASFSLITSIILSICLLPKSREKHPVLMRIGYAFQWLLVPFTVIFLSALPALDAQTRLMLGKYMTFWVTDKKRK